MISSITYPSYPKDFNMNKRLFPTKKNREINRNIKKGINDIILKVKIGHSKEFDNTYLIEDDLNVRVTYNNGEFKVYINDKENSYEAPVESNLQFDPVEHPNELYYVIKEHLENEFEDRLITQEQTIHKDNLVKTISLTFGATALLLLTIVLT